MSLPESCPPTDDHDVTRALIACLSDDALFHRSAVADVLLEERARRVRRLAEHGGTSQRSLARSLGVPNVTLRSWLAKTSVDNSGA